MVCELGVIVITIKVKLRRTSNFVLDIFFLNSIHDRLFWVAHGWWGRQKSPPS